MNACLPDKNIHLVSNLLLSLNQDTEGVGTPSAKHVIVTLSPIKTSMSVEFGFFIVGAEQFLVMFAITSKYRPYQV